MLYGTAPKLVERVATTPKFKGRACAKINLFLHIGEKQICDLHEIFSLNVFVSLCDVLHYDPCFEGQKQRPTKNNSHLLVSGMPPHVVLEHQSSIQKIFAVFAQKRDQRLPAINGKITIKKSIPARAGLGGGSSDAAITLHILTKSDEQIPEPPLIASSAVAVGSDLYTCMLQRANFVAGCGNDITPLSLRLSQHLLAKTAVVILTPRHPKARLSTAKMYHRFDQKSRKSVRRCNLIPYSLQTFKYGRIGQNRQNFFWRLQHHCRNDFTSIAIQYVPVLHQAIALLKNTIPEQSMLVRMSGSGSSCFAIFPSFAHAKAAQNQIIGSSYAKKFLSVHIARVIV